MDRVVKFVLNRSEKFLARIGLPVVVDAGRKDIAHFPIKDLFAASNVANAVEQFVEIIAPGLLQSMVVQRKAFNDLLPKPLRSPLPEMCANVGLNAITDGEYNVEVVMFEITVNTPFALNLNCSEFPNSCVFD